MAVDRLPAWQEEALQKMRERLKEWLPDDKLHLVLIRAPFHDRLGREITDPAFEELLATDPDAAQQQLLEEFEADRLAAIERDRLRQQEQQDGAQALRSFVGDRRRSRARSKAQAHSSDQPTLLP